MCTWLYPIGEILAVEKVWKKVSVRVGLWKREKQLVHFCVSGERKEQQ